MRVKRCDVRLCRAPAVTNFGVLQLCAIHLTAVGVPLGVVQAIERGERAQIMVGVAPAAVGAPQGDVRP